MSAAYVAAKRAELERLRGEVAELDRREFLKEQPPSTVPHDTTVRPVHSALSPDASLLALYETARSWLSALAALHR